MHACPHRRADRRGLRGARRRKTPKAAATRRRGRDSSATTSKARWAHDAALAGTHLAFDVVAELSERLYAGHFFGLDFKTETSLDDDHNVHKVEAVNAQVVFEQSLGMDLFFVDFEIVDEKFAYVFFYFLSCHGGYINEIKWMYRSYRRGARRFTGCVALRAGCVRGRVRRARRPPPILRAR